ncbi:hypothetical protein MMF93_30180 [Streptomyces tubbatahanensis]|uniref:Uncharacterized protein n=1 Tax=Streptomyces tubbatahanensis TaxID=2923272 RepID=A0ABY3Y0X8_9ACTN|nr:hypothetical protein [Streptomyces tubbatahanensis]UNT00255.1 hypothetical protein MMF93_30180 [Streptomyces tubbatahanensis]
MADPVKNAKTDSAKKPAAATRTVAEAGGAAGSAGEAVKRKGEAAKNTLASATSTASAAATAGLVAVTQRKKIAAGAGGSLLALLAGAFALGRTTTRRRTGPLTRLTGGRI